MCTVSFIPTSPNNFILTSNRDESPLRSPETISYRKEKNHELIFPQDIKGGTWICASSDNKLICILNGAFQKHNRIPPYRKSRGIIALDFFNAPSAEIFFKEYDLENIEPFTMVIWDNGRLFELRRDEKKTHFKQLDENQKYLWSCATLYTEEVKEKRQMWFQEWLKTSPIMNKKNIFDFHKNTGDGDIYNDFIMNRKNIVRTVSITQVEKNNDSIQLNYNDLLRDNFVSKEIELLGEPV